MQVHLQTISPILLMVRVPVKVLSSSSGLYFPFQPVNLSKFVSKAEFYHAVVVSFGQAEK